MGDIRTRRVTLAILLLVSAGIGCNPFTLPFFFTRGESKLDADYSLARMGVKANKKKKEFTVAIVSYATRGLSPDAIGIDRELSTQFAKKLTEECVRNEEKIKVIPIQQVEKYKSEHPNWSRLGPIEIGKELGADFVIDMEVAGFSLFEGSSHAMFFRGRAHISLAVFDMASEGHEAAFKKDLIVLFPEDGGVPRDLDTNIETFRQQFVARVARDLTWLFTDRLVSESFGKR
jgi:hypothetical protein